MHTHRCPPLEKAGKGKGWPWGDLKRMGMCGVQWEAGEGWPWGDLKENGRVRGAVGGWEGEGVALA